MFTKIPLLLGSLCGSVILAQTYPVNVAPTAMTRQSEWRYSTSEPPAGWAEPAFDDAIWGTGPGGFGATGTPGAVVGTVWNDTNIWLRKTFSLANAASRQNLALVINHDENVEVYINGIQVFSEWDYTVRYVTHTLDAEARAAFKEGVNVLAVHCRQTLGGQYIDVGIIDQASGTSTVLVGDARTLPAQWKYTTVDPSSTSWIDPDFTDAGWSTGTGGFGVNTALEASIGTAWETDNIWLRKTFALPAMGFNNYTLSINHDDDAQIYLNGLRVALVSGNHTHMIGTATLYQDLDITEGAQAALRPGQNVIAVHCRNLPQNPGQIGATTQYIDLSLTGALVQAGSPVKPGTRAAAGAGERPRFYAWKPGQGRLLIGTGSRTGYRRFDFIGKRAR